MMLRDFYLVAVGAAVLLVGSVDTSMAQQKKKPQPQAANPYKECCDKANARYYVDNGKATCLMMSEQQQDALYQCTNQRGIRVISGGQMSM